MDCRMMLWVISFSLLINLLQIFSLISFLPFHNFWFRFCFISLFLLLSAGNIWNWVDQCLITGCLSRKVSCSLFSFSFCLSSFLVEAYEIYCLFIFFLFVGIFFFVASLCMVEVSVVFVHLNLERIMKFLLEFWYEFHISYLFQVRNTIWLLFCCYWSSYSC